MAESEERLGRVECTVSDVCRPRQGSRSSGAGQPCCAQAVLPWFRKGVMVDAEFLFRRLTVGDVERLCCFYNGLSTRSKRLFAPLGATTTEEQCRPIAEANLPDRDTRHDIVILHEGGLVGWAFLAHNKDKPREAGFGIGIGDDYQGRGLGSRLMAAVMRQAKQRGLERISLCVVCDNQLALRLYRKHGFVHTGELVGKQDGLLYHTMVKQLETSGAQHSHPHSGIPVRDSARGKPD